MENTQLNGKLKAVEALNSATLKELEVFYLEPGETKLGKDSEEDAASGSESSDVGKKITKARLAKYCKSMESQDAKEMCNSSASKALTECVRRVDSENVIVKIALQLEGGKFVFVFVGGSVEKGWF